MEIFWERPGQGGQSEPIARFLEEQGLRPDHGVQATVSLREDGRTRPVRGRAWRRF